ncbi:MAG: hypothetical protein Phog2KO_38330 [Phototrophicaceae bacterium]
MKVKFDGIIKYKTIIIAKINKVGSKNSPSASKFKRDDDILQTPRLCILIIT